MKRDTINYLVVGLFVLAMGAALLVLLYRITGREGPTDGFYVTYGNVAGVISGTAVYYEGYQIGQVDSIVPMVGDNGVRYRVNLSIVKGWRIPEDSVARIVASGLLSAVAIDIEEGKSRTLLQPGAEIRGREQGNIMAVLNDVAADFRQLSAEGLRPALQNFNARLDELSTELTDLSRTSVRPLIATLQEKVQGADQIRAQLEGFLARMDENARRLQALLGDDNQRHISNSLKNMEQVSKDLHVLVNRMEQTRLQLSDVLDGIDGLIRTNQPGVTSSVADLQESMADLRKTLRVLADNVDSIMYNVEGGARNMNELSRQLREYPGLLLKSSPPRDPARE